MKKLSYLLLILVSVFCCVLPVYAADEYDNLIDRKDLTNYGIKKKQIKITNDNKNNILSTKYVDPSRKVYDYADILTDEEEDELRDKINKFIDKYDTELVIVTDSFSYYSDSKNEEYASDFYDYNDFGLDYKHYDGLVLLRNANPGDPYYGSYSFGEAQLYIDYDRNERILDNIYGSMKSGDYYNAMSRYIDYVARDYDNGIAPSMKNAYIDDMGYVKYKFVPPVGLAFIIAFVVSLIIVLILVARNKMVKKATKANEYINKDSVSITGRQDIFRNSITTHYTVSSSSGGGGHGGSHRGSSGMGHGGGGRHG